MYKAFQNNMKKLIYLIPFVLLFACTPQKRLHRLIDMYPELLETINMQTVDTFIVHELRIDTAYKLDTFIDRIIRYDTIRVSDGSTTAKIYRYHDTVFVDILRASDTIYREISVPVEQIVVKKDSSFKTHYMAFWWVYLIVLGCFILLMYLIILIRRALGNKQ